MECEFMNLLETTSWIIDVLPRRASKTRAKQYSRLILTLKDFDMWGLQENEYSLV